MIRLFILTVCLAVLVGAGSAGAVPAVTATLAIGPRPVAVAVDPSTHHSFYPVPAGANGRPTLLEREPVS